MVGVVIRKSNTWPVNKQHQTISNTERFSMTFLHFSAVTSHTNKVRISVCLPQKDLFGNEHLAIYVMTKQNHRWSPVASVILEHRRKWQTRWVMSTADEKPNLGVASELVLKKWYLYKKISRLILSISNTQRYPRTFAVAYWPPITVKPSVFG